MVNTQVVDTFIDSLERRITEVLVDAPDVKEPLGEALAHTTTLPSSVEKAHCLRRGGGGAAVWRPPALREEMEAEQ
eukprot:gene13203-15577_t